MKAQVYRNYGAIKRQGVCCEVDHLISRDVRGADDIANLWPEPWRQAPMKDRLEVRLNKEVCAGRMLYATTARVWKFTPIPDLNMDFRDLAIRA
jgi:hypothetical protein